MFQAPGSASEDKSYVARPLPKGFRARAPVFLAPSQQSTTPILLLVLSPMKALYAWPLSLQGLSAPCVIPPAISQPRPLPWSGPSAGKGVGGGVMQPHLSWHSHDYGLALALMQFVEPGKGRGATVEPGQFYRLPGDFCLWPPCLKGPSRVILGNFVIFLFFLFLSLFLRQGLIVWPWKSETHYVDRPFFKLMEISLPLQIAGHGLKHGFLYPWLALDIL